MPTPDEIRQMNESYRQDFNRHDSAALRGYYADRIEWTSAGSDEPVTCGDDIPASYEALFRSYPDVRLDEFLHDFSEGNLNAHHWIMRGTNTGPIGEGDSEIPPTGRSVEIRGLSMLVLDDDGKIVRDHTYFDTGSLNRQLGLG